MATPVTLDAAVAKTFIKYARLVAARGYVHNTLGNIAMRVPHPDYPHGVAYTKHAELSLEEMEAENIVLTDIPTSRILLGDKVTSIGHNLSREILRLRPDIHATGNTNSVVLLGHGVTTLGRNISEAYHRPQLAHRGSAAQHRGGTARVARRHQAGLPERGGNPRDVSLRRGDHLSQARR